VLAGECPRDFARIFVLYPDNLVDNLSIEHFWDEPGSDALYFVSPWLAAREDRRIVRLHSHRLKRGLALFYDFAHAGDGPAGTYTGHEYINLTVRVVPDLFCRGLTVDFGVGWVIELLWHEVIVALADYLFGLFDCPGHALAPAWSG